MRIRLLVLAADISPDRTRFDAKLRQSNDYAVADEKGTRAAARVPFARVNRDYLP